MSEGRALETSSTNVNERSDGCQLCCAFQCCYDGCGCGTTIVISSIFGGLTLVYGILSYIILDTYSYNDIESCYNEYINDPMNDDGYIPKKVEQKQYNSLYYVTLVSVINSLISVLITTYFFYCLSQKLVWKKCPCLIPTVWTIFGICAGISIILLFWLCPGFGCVVGNGYLGINNICVDVNDDTTTGALITVNTIFMVLTIAIPTSAIIIGIAMAMKG